MDTHTSRRDGALPVSPGLAEEESYLPELETPPDIVPVDRRTALIAGLAILIAIGAGLVAQLLTALIAFITNVSFYHTVSFTLRSPGGAHVGAWVIVIPVLGALIIGVMARYGSAAIRGHGIPEVMERVLYGESRIPARVMVLKPLSAAVAIGTGGPFGAEGPIIATGGAIGSLVGQILHGSDDERKTLLAAGAAAGMAATFGSPISAVLLAVELLLFEYRARSLIPVALAAAAATAVRVAFRGSGTDFAIGTLAQAHGEALVFYTLIGAIVGAAAAYVTRITYGIEDLFEKLPVHWAWWPAIGAVFLGVIGYFQPRVLGIGYENITSIINGEIVGSALAVFVIAKFLAWSIYLGSGTSGGTLAPLFTVGGGLGALLGSGLAIWMPSAHVDPRIAALVGMTAMFAGASHALLAAIVFTFEITRQPFGLLPLLAGGTAAYFVSLLLNRNSIMTEKLARRGAIVRVEYTADYLAQRLVRDTALRDVVALRASDTLGQVRRWLGSRADGSSHQGFPVLDDAGLLAGVLTRRDLIGSTEDESVPLSALVTRPPVVVFADNTMRDAADQMVRASVGRLPVVERHAPRRVIGMISRSDLLSAHAGRLNAGERKRGRVKL
ncbi:MAG TPA: chloride channel protein [Gemmatimonadaceae bacterium]|nr:chloride channel protein [Gemmatimonadaceae bacterium]